MVHYTEKTLSIGIFRLEYIGIGILSSRGENNVQLIRCARS